MERTLVNEGIGKQSPRMRSNCSGIETQGGRDRRRGEDRRQQNVGASEARDEAEDPRCDSGCGALAHGPAVLRATRQIRSHKSPKSIPAALADCGRRLVAVIPGRVFTSKQTSSPFGVKRKSTRESPP